MADINKTPEADPFDAPAPGQSLTDEPGKWAWEKPPVHATPREAVNAIILQLQEPDTYRNTLDLMYSGLTIESITKSLTFVAFQEGLMTPDVAELANIYLFFYIRGMATKAGIEPRLFNTDDTARVDVPEMLETLDPDKLNQIVNATEDPKVSEEMAGTFINMRDADVESKIKVEPTTEPIQDEIEYGTDE